MRRHSKTQILSFCTNPCGMDLLQSHIACCVASSDFRIFEITSGNKSHGFTWLTNNGKRAKRSATTKYQVLNVIPRPNLVEIGTYSKGMQASNQSHLLSFMIGIHCQSLLHLIFSVNSSWSKCSQKKSTTRAKASNTLNTITSKLPANIKASSPSTWRLQSHLSLLSASLLRFLRRLIIFVHCRTRQHGPLATMMHEICGTLLDHVIAAMNSAMWLTAIGQTWKGRFGQPVNPNTACGPHAFRIVKMERKHSPWKRLVVAWHSVTAMPWVMLPPKVLLVSFVAVHQNESWTLSSRPPALPWPEVDVSPGSRATFKPWRTTNNAVAYEVFRKI